MKIGILTFHRALNYGAVLQCFALNETLRKKGHDVEIIDYRPTCIEKERWTFYNSGFKTKDFKGKIKYILQIPYRFLSRRKASRTFDAFMEKNFKFSHIVSTPEDIPSYYDVIIFGSDQIWSAILCGGFDPIYYGQIEKGKSRFISYAASLEGYQRFLPAEWESISRKLEKFDAISVRERTFRDELAKRIKKSVEWVVDPTLLVPPLMFEKIAVRPVYERYVFLFTVQPGDLPYRVAKKIATDRDAIIVRARSVGRMNLQNREESVINIEAVSPESFVGLIRYAECVVTNSFHATAISIQLRKDFCTVESLHPNRIIDLLSNVGLLNHYVTHAEDIDKEIPSIDYDSVHTRLSVMKSNSDNYLMKNL